MDAFNLFWPQVPNTTAAPSSTSGQLPNGLPTANPALLPPFFGHVNISPTVKVVDGNLGLPTADAFDPYDPRLLCNGGPSNAILDLIQRLNANTAACNLATTTQLLEARGFEPPADGVASTGAFGQTAALVAACSSSASSVHSEASREHLPPTSSGVLGGCSTEGLQPPTSLPFLSAEQPAWTQQPTTADGFLTAALNALLVREENAEAAATADSNGQDALTQDQLERQPKAICSVCSDRASGLHYGVQSCEGCKGFFRRSIQQKIAYRPCSKSQNCAIVRNNRNRCQFCRLKKCLSVGMSRDAVRFGRVPKREKVKMAEEMKKATIRSQMDAMAVELEDENTTVTSVHSAFVDLGEKLRSEAASGSIGDEHAASPALNSSALLPLAVATADFAKGVPGFRLLYTNDRLYLLKASFFQVLLLRLSGLKNANCSPIDPAAVPHHLLIRETAENALLCSKIVDFVTRFRMLGLDEQQLGLFAALVLCQSDATASHQFEEASLVKVLQEKLWWLLRSAIFPNPQTFHTVQGQLFLQSLIVVLGELKELDALYAEQLQRVHCFSATPPLTSLLSVDPFGELSKPIRAPEPAALPPKTETIRELLSRPSLVLQQKAEVPADPREHKRDHEEEDEEQPLNLCIRDARR